MSDYHRSHCTYECLLSYNNKHVWEGFSSHSVCLSHALKIVMNNNRVQTCVHIAARDGAGLRTHRRTDLSSQQVVWAPEVQPRPLLLHEKRPWICTPANARYPITAGWTGGAGGRQMEIRWKNCLLNSWPRALSPGHNHYTTQLTHTQKKFVLFFFVCMHSCTHTHTHTPLTPLLSLGISYLWVWTFSASLLLLEFPFEIFFCE